ncbi:MAG: hypothetical protein K2W99_04850 [Chthoniobacterales bacterium]|nr:hypothetical protein [Chthoniobacterales bacterium]
MDSYHFLWTFFLVLQSGSSSVRRKKINSLIQEKNVTYYQRSGNIHDLQDKKFLEIPYPSAERLALILSYPAVQQVLPSNIHKPSPDGTAVEGRYDQAVAFLLSHYFILIGLGILIALGALLLVLF